MNPFRAISFIALIVAGVTIDNAEALANAVLSSNDVEKIARGGVAVIHDFLPHDLIVAMRSDARDLFETGEFQPDGLTNTARKRSEQGFTAKADRQTFRGGADWTTNVGNLQARMDFLNRMTTLREQLAVQLNRPSLGVDDYNDDGEWQQRHEITYNWYEPGAKLGRHLDEHHEETKGVKGWLLGTRRSVTWLVYLNDKWEASEGGALRCYPRKKQQLSTDIQVGCHEGNLQVGWLDNHDPVFLDCFRPSGMSALYRVVKNAKNDNNSNERQLLTKADFDVPAQPIEFVNFLPSKYQNRFEQISTARRDPRFASRSSVDDDNNNIAATTAENDYKQEHYIDITPKAGTLVVFDSVSLPHLVREVTGTRQRIAATGWFHEDSQCLI